MLLRNVEIAGRRADVRISGGVITGVTDVAARPPGTRDPGTRDPGARDVDGRGAALIPGLHDHHIHLLATAAARESVTAGPPAVHTPAELGHALRHGPIRHGWVRAVGYDESVAGDLDRDLLDALCPDRPVRVQHRGGALWTVNSAGAALLDLDHAPTAGVERDAAGRATGRLWRADDWLAQRLGRHTPDLAYLGRALAATGITGVTDATPTLADTAALLATAHHDGALPQRITVLAADLDHTPDGITLGPAKIVVPDHQLPGTDALADEITHARTHDRAVAVHCVTREALLLTLSVLAELGPVPGDRVEHAAVAPPEAATLAASLGLTVVTQPSLLAQRGDDYLDRVDSDDRDHLWPWQSLRQAGIPVAGSSDAPYGDPDPWAGIRAAVTRTTSSGRVLGAPERVPAEVALAAWSTPPHAPGGPPRRIAPGAPADVVLLDAPLADVLTDPDAKHVRLTVIGGRVVHDTTGTP